jgi:hypothetical protein
MVARFKIEIRSTIMVMAANWVLIVELVVYGLITRGYHWQIPLPFPYHFHGELSPPLP